MKTTSGKTKAPRKEARIIHIYAEGHRGLIASRNASSLKQALEEYFRDSLSEKWKKVKIVGNTLSVESKSGAVKQTFRALETYQKP